MQADQNLLVRTLVELFHYGFHTPCYLVGGFPTRRCGIHLPAPPVLHQLPVNPVKLVKATTLKIPPMELIQSLSGQERNFLVLGIFQKRGQGLTATLQQRAIKSVKTFVGIGIIKQTGLHSTCFIERGIVTASLNQIMEVEIGLTVPKEIN